MWKCMDYKNCQITYPSTQPSSTDGNVNCVKISGNGATNKFPSYQIESDITKQLYTFSWDVCWKDASAYIHNLEISKQPHDDKNLISPPLLTQDQTGPDNSTPSYLLGYLLVFIPAYVVTAVIAGYFGNRKNRNKWGWGLIGGLFLLPAIFILIFLPFLCPKCKQPLTNHEWENRSCPRCGSIS